MLLQNNTVDQPTHLDQIGDGMFCPMDIVMQFVRHDFTLTQVMALVSFVQIAEQLVSCLVYVVIVIAQVTWHVHFHVYVSVVIAFPAILL